MNEINEQNPTVPETSNERGVTTGHSRSARLRGLALLLVLAVLMVGIGTSCDDNCSCSCDSDCKAEPPYSNNTTKLVPVAPQQVLYIYTKREPGAGYWGEASYREFHVTGADYAKLTWSPDMKVIEDGSFSFNQPPLPGGPPFVWENVPDDLNIRADFTYGANTSYTGNYNTFDLVRAEAANPNDPNLPPLKDDYQSKVPVAFRFADTLNTQAATVDQRQEAAPGAHTSTADPQIWQVSLGIFPPTVNLTAANCQSTMTLLSGPEAFLAVRLPISPTLTPSGAVGYDSPLLFGADSEGNDLSPKLRIFANPEWQTLVEGNMELRPERLPFLEETLPAADGEAWLALGLASDAPDCPPDSAAPANEWDAALVLNLDLNQAPNTCIGCELLLYGCWEGQELPPVAAIEATSFAASNITCIGPQRVTLAPNPGDWTLIAPTSAIITPTETISFSYGLRSINQPISVTLTLSSSLPVDWTLFHETPDGLPDLNRPLPPTVNAGFDTLWFRAMGSALPAGTAHGPYVVEIHAVNQDDATDDRFVDNFIWVGDWVAPPPEPATTPVTVSIADISVGEGSGATSLTVTLNRIVNQNVEVSFASADGAATQPADYTAVTGKVTIAAGKTTATITVPIVDNQVVEGNATFSVNLSGPVHATIARGQGVVTIVDNDGTVNRNPAAGNDSATTPRGAAVAIAVLANDSDADGDALTITISGQPGHGTAAVSSGQVVYTPSADFAGADSFTYTVADGKGGVSNVATVSVTVTDGATTNSSTYLPLVNR